MNSQPQDMIAAPSPQQEKDALRQQKSRQRRMGLLLLLFAAIILGLTAWLIIRTGFVPYDDRDIFRSV